MPQSCLKTKIKLHGNDAAVSAGGRYRYVLTRRLGSGRPALFILLNPSNADAALEDSNNRRSLRLPPPWV